MKIILVHGMGRTPLSMLRLSHRLRQQGHDSYLFRYSATFESLARVSARLAHLVRQKTPGAPYVLVGHSLGSAIIRHTLAPLAPHFPAACFFLAPPMVACKAAKFFSRFWWYRIVMGEMGQLLAQEEFMQSLPVPDNLTIYAGVAGPRLSWLPFGEEFNDGILSLSEMIGATEEASHVRVVKIPARHTFIMNSRAVLQDMVAALQRIESAPANPAAIKHPAHPPADSTPAPK